MIEEKISMEIKEQMAKSKEIEVVLKLDKLDEETLNELREFGEILIVVKLTKYLLLRVPADKIQLLAKKENNILKPLLESLLTSKLYIQKLAIISIELAFYKTGKREALEAIKPLLKDKDLYTRRAAAWAIGEIYRGTASREALQALEAIKPLLKDQYMQEVVARAIEYIYRGTRKEKEKR